MIMELSLTSLSFGVIFVRSGSIFLTDACERAGIKRTFSFLFHFFISFSFLFFFFFAISQYINLAPTDKNLEQYKCQ